MLHPILFGLYPVLFAYAHNLDFAPARTEIVILSALFGACAALLWIGLAGATGDWQKAGIGVSVFFLMFFSYGHLTSLIGVPLSGFRLFSVSLGMNRAPALVWIAVALIAVRWLRNLSREAAATATVFLNRFGVVLTLLVALNWATSEYSSAHAQNLGQPRSLPVAAASPAPRVVARLDLPDIYYIILDDYARADVLENLFHYDNSPFLNALRAKGFYVADRSHSNYSQTMLSLASSLNSMYLEDLQLPTVSTGSQRSGHVAMNVAAARYFEKGRAFGIDGTGLTRSRLPLAHMIQYSNTARTLQEHGYRFAAFTSGYGGVQLPNADVV